MCLLNTPWCTGLKYGYFFQTDQQKSKMDESSSNFSFLGSSLTKKLPDSSSNSTQSPYAASPYWTESSTPTRDDLGFSTSSLVSKFVTTPAAQVLPSSGRFNPNKEEAATSTDTNFAAPRNDNPVNERRPNYLGPTVSRASSSSTISSVGDVDGKNDENFALEKCFHQLLLKHL